MTKLSLLACVLLMTACGGGTRSFTNPVLDRNFPDPFVLKAGDTYYAYATNGNGSNVQTATSKDLVHWTAGADALPKLGSWDFPGSTWAPEVLARSDGSYVLYYTASSGTQCVGRAVAQQPQGPFVDSSPAPLVCQKPEGGSIDPSPFRDSDGSLYLYWKSDGNSIGKRTAIWAAKLTADGTALAGAPHATGETNGDEAWEGSVVEAPVMWKHAGRYFLFYSGGNFADDSYAVGYATCRRPLGPCTDARENPILKTACRAHGPGHNALLAVDGQLWIVYHAWLPGHAGDKRVLWLDRLDWKDGNPIAHGPTCTAQTVP